MVDFKSIQEDKFWYVEQHEVALVNALSFGWTEDGRCGLEGQAHGSMQLCPKPIPLVLGKHPLTDKYVYVKASAGSRHTAFLTINSANRQLLESSGRRISGFNDRLLTLALTGLNQMGLCEESGFPVPVEIMLQIDSSADEICDIATNNGATYVLTKNGQVYSFGNNSFGKLGYMNDKCDENCSTPTYLHPRLISSLYRKYVCKLATSAHHVIALTEDQEIFAWGKNDKGQLGRGFESKFDSVPGIVKFPSGVPKCKIISISCGQEHSAVLMQHIVPSHSTASDVKRPVSESFVFCFGDGSRGQLGSGDQNQRAHPQENFWVTRFLRKLKVQLSEIICGGYFTLGLVSYSGQVIAWGANEYGQLGIGHQHDSAEPVLIRGLQKVYLLSAGLRHCLAAAESALSFADVYSWGFNNWGELGLGDTDIRLTPTKVTALKNTRIYDVSCGDRHSVVVTAHKQLMGRDIPALRPMLRLLKEESVVQKRKSLIKRLKRRIQREGQLHPEILDNPDLPLPNQVGSSTNERKNDLFEKGLRYCLDTYCDEYDWRRQAMEVCFRVTISPKITLQSVCLSCSRRCVSSFRMVPYIRSRNKSDPRSLVCDCNATGNCQCRWSPIREVFDKFAVSESDQCINKMQLKKVLKLLRSPFPVEASDIDDAILVLGSTKAPPQPQRKKLSLFARSAGEEGQESAEIFKAADLRDDVTESASLSLMDDDVRIDAVSFERWYRQYYDEPEKSDDMQLVRESQVGNAEQGNDRQILDEDSLGSYL